ncbi:MAG TPA: hypothetical protein VFW33_21905, partial [Gemmataceae bacterium]|nr:hypothetical protein [Gemmataceae bacterium]
MNSLRVVALAAGLAAALLGLGTAYVHYQQAQQVRPTDPEDSAAPAPAPRPAPRPAPKPKPAPCPNCPRCPRTGWNYGCALCHWILPQPLAPWMPPAIDPAGPVHPQPAAPAPAQQLGDPAPAQQLGDPEPMVDALAMPSDVRRHNIAAKGLGCCVFRSIDYASWWQNVPELHRFPEWMVSSGIQGGGWPQKVDALIPKIATAHGVPAPRYVQYEGSNPAIIELALKTGRLPGITWQGNHMLSCVYLGAEKAGILDNNAPDKISWYSRKDFLARWTAPGGKGGWVVVLLNHGPPPVPKGAPATKACCEAPKCKCYPCNCRGTRRCDPACECESARCGCNAELRCQEDCFCGDGPHQRPHRPRPRPRPRPKFEDVVPADEVPAGVVEWAAPARESYSLCGNQCSEAEAVRAIADDSARNHLTVIGDEAGRKAVLADLASSPSLNAWAQKCRVQSYAPDAWELAVGFTSRPGPRPTVVVQDPSGRVLLRAAYSTPAALAGALRRADPSYDPAKDPDGSPPVKPSSPNVVPPLPPWATPERCAGGLGAAGFGAAAYLLLRRRHQQSAGPPQNTPA